jgi:hypothetical protein
MTPESQARWYATRVVLTLVIIIGGFMAIAYVDIFWAFAAIALFFVAMVAAALYAEAYDRKLVELLVELNEKK